MSNYMPNIEDIYRDRTLYIKEMETYLENLKKKENKSMSNTANLGKSFQEQLTEACSKFVKWIEESNAVIDAFNAVKASVETMKELDNTMVEMQKITDKTVEEIRE